MKKWLVCLIALALCAALASCRTEKTPDAGTETPETEAAARVTLIDAASGTDYVIVRTDVKGDYEYEMSVRLQNAVKEATGTELALRTDWYKDSYGFAPTAHEILVGTTNRSETEAVLADWRTNGYRDWTVRLAGEKIVIYGGSPAALSEAVEHFISHYVQNGAVAVPDNLNDTYLHTWPLDAIRIGGHDIGEFQIVVGAGGNAMIDAAAAEVQGFVLNNTGIQLGIVKDSFSKKEIGCEILIGPTLRTTDPVREELTDAGKYGYVVRLDGTKLSIAGTMDLTVGLAAKCFTSGGAGTITDGVYTVAENTFVGSGDILNSGVTAVMKETVAPRAALGRSQVLSQHRRASGIADLRDVDIYANLAMNTIFMPEGEVTEADIDLANRVIQKVTHFMNTMTPTSVMEKNGGNGVKGECDFAANRLCRAFYAPEGRLTAETMAEVTRFFLEDDFDSKYFSENHMLMFRVARYLAACALEGQTFRQYKKSAEEIRKIDYDYLVDFLQFRARRGWAEFDSMGYGIEDFLSLVNLYDCAPDEELRTLAAMSMDTMLLSMILDSTEYGIYGGAHGRNYGVVTSNMSSGMKFLFDLYFGGGNVNATDVGANVHGASFVYSSAYRPGDILYAIVFEKAYPLYNFERVHNHTMEWTPKEYGSIDKSTYSTALYSIGAVNRQDSFPEGGYEEHQQTNWSMTFAQNSRATLTTHHPGNTGTHAYWYGDHDCCCNHLYHNENVVMGIYYIPGNAGAYNFIHAYVPKAEYEETVEVPEKNMIFVRLGDAYAMLRFSAAYAWAEDNSKEVKIFDGERKSNIRIAMVCEAGDVEHYGSFVGFMEKMKQKEMTFDRDTLTLTYGNLKHQAVISGKQATTERTWVDGVEQQFHYGYTYDSPYMKAVWDSGVIEVYFGDAVRVMDFMNATDTMKKKN